MTQLVSWFFHSLIWLLNIYIQKNFFSWLESRLLQHKSRERWEWTRWKICSAASREKNSNFSRRIYSGENLKSCKRKYSLFLRQQMAKAEQASSIFPLLASLAKQQKRNLFIFSLENLNIHAKNPSRTEIRFLLPDFTHPTFCFSSLASTQLLPWDDDKNELGNIWSSLKAVKRWILNLINHSNSDF